MKPTILFKHKGFTLVEALVAGSLSIFVFLIIISLFNMSMNQVSGSSIRSLTKMQYQTMIDQIGGDVRKASKITSRLPDTGNVISPSDSILLFDSLGNVFAKYKRSFDSLMEWNGTQFVFFKIGSKNVKVSNVGSNNTFAIGPARNNVMFNLNVVGIDGSRRDTIFSTREIFRCRNY